MTDPAKRKANQRYDEKTYKKITVSLRVKEDMEIIADIEKAKNDGKSLREWLNKLYQEGEKGFESR